MAMHLLAPRQVQAAKVGVTSDGGGLALVVTERGSSWTFRYTAPDGRHREMGLGPAARDTLAQAGESVALARKAADRARQLVIEGVDPIERRKAEREAAQAAANATKLSQKAEQTTLARFARQYHTEEIEKLLSTKHGAQWLASLELNVPPAIWNAPIATITAYDLLGALRTLAKRVPETARRVRQRLENIFDDAMLAGVCQGNPAAAIAKRLSPHVEYEKGNFSALDYRRVPAFVADLRKQPGTAARMLEFAMMCASRTGEVLCATWDEFDLQAGVWRIPGRRMKGRKGRKVGEDHVVHLSQRALEIIESMRELQGDPYVFPSPLSSEKPLSNMAMLAVIKRMGLKDVTTPHGVCRAAFSTWANETGIGREDVVERCLAHVEPNKVKASYNRADYAAERAALLRAWSDFCDGKKVEAVKPPSAEVIPMARAA